MIKFNNKLFHVLLWVEFNDLLDKLLILGLKVQQNKGFDLFEPAKPAYIYNKYKRKLILQEVNQHLQHHILIPILQLWISFSYLVLELELVLVKGQVKGPVLGLGLYLVLEQV